MNTPEVLKPNMSKDWDTMPRVFPVPDQPTDGVVYAEGTVRSYNSAAVSLGHIANTANVINPAH